MQQNDRGMTPKPTIGRVCFISWWSIFECGFTGVILIGVNKEPETEIHRERGSIAPRKVFAHPESFCADIFFTLH